MFTTQGTLKSVNFLNFPLQTKKCGGRRESMKEMKLLWRLLHPDGLCPSSWAPCRCPYQPPPPTGGRAYRLPRKGALPGWSAPADPPVCFIFGLPYKIYFSLPPPFHPFLPSFFFKGKGSCIPTEEMKTSGLV